jgi:predicted Zn-dependent peptidase
MLAPLLLSLLSAAPPSTPAPAPAQTPLTLTATTQKLSNGMVVILSPDHSVPGVVVDITYKVGSRDEVVGRTGFAHLFEHLMFMGSTHAPYPQFDMIMEASGGQNNASTSNDRTNYFEIGPSNLLETFLWLEADRLQTLPDTMTDEKVNTQRLVVQNERRQSYENRPYGVADLEMYKALYPPDHPYSWPVIGSHADLEAASTQDVKDFFHRFYTPANAILSIVGDFDPDQATALVQKYFGWMEARPPGPRPTPPQPKLASAKRLDLTDRVELPKAILAFHSPAENLPGDATADLMAAILGGGKSSRLYHSLVYDRRIAQEVSANQESLALGSVFRIEMLAVPGHTGNEQLAAADAVLQKFREQGPTQEELDAAKLQVKTILAHNVEGLVSRAELLNRMYEFYGDATAIGKELARYEAVTTQDVQNLAKQILVPEHVAIVVNPAEESAEEKKP